MPPKRSLLAIDLPVQDFHKKRWIVSQLLASTSKDTSRDPGKSAMFGLADVALKPASLRLSSSAASQALVVANSSARDIIFAVGRWYGASPQLARLLQVIPASGIVPADGEVVLHVRLAQDDSIYFGAAVNVRLELMVGLAEHWGGEQDMLCLSIDAAVLPTS